MSRSRRGFLKSAAAGLNLSWAGLRIVAGGEVRHAAQASPAPRSGTQFICGTQFYRPSNPPRAQRREMLRTIAQHYRFNLIRVYPMWDYYHRAPDRFVFDEIEEVMKYADEFDLKVLMGIVMETAPYWLEQAHPETRYVDAKGQPQRLQGSPAQMTGGWPGLCEDWPPVREAARRFIHELVKVVAPHRSMYAYDCWNEPHIEPAGQKNIWATAQEHFFCYCSRTIDEFRKWLQERYQTIDTLNEAWTRQFPNWNAIDPPRSLGTYADWVDWRRYIIERSTKCMHFRADTVREFDGKHIVGSHAHQMAPLDSAAINGTDGWRLAEVVDLWGTSVFPRHRVAPYLGSAKLDLVRSHARGKEFWLTELQGGHFNQGLARGPEMRPRDIRLWNWLALAAGAKGVVYWGYHAEGTGREATGFGLVNRDGTATDRSEEAARNKRLIEDHWDIVRNHRPRPKVGLVFDSDNALLTFAMNGNEQASTESFRGYYKALWNLDLQADVIEPSKVDRASYEVLIVPFHISAKRPTCDRLRQFVEAGGTLILESSFGLFDERFYHNPVVPPHGLDGAFGYREEASYAVLAKSASGPVTEGVSPSDEMYYEPAIRFSAPVQVEVKAHTFLTALKLASATGIATSHGHTVAARKRVGKGEVFYIGTNLGASIARGDRGGIELLRSIVWKAVQPEVTADVVRPRLIEGGARGLLAVFNDTHKDQAATIRIPARYRRATDVHREVEIALEKQAIRVTVPHEDVVVLRLDS